MSTAYLQAVALLLFLAFYFSQAYFIDACNIYSSYIENIKKLSRYFSAKKKIIIIKLSILTIYSTCDVVFLSPRWIFLSDNKQGKLKIQLLDKLACQVLLYTPETLHMVIKASNLISRREIRKYFILTKYGIQ